MKLDLEPLDDSMDLSLPDLVALGLHPQMLERFSDDVVRPTLAEEQELIRRWMTECGATEREITEALLEGLGDDGYPT